LLILGSGRAEAQTSVVSFATVSALQSTTSIPTGTLSVAVQDYATAGDRGGGLFLLDASASEPSDNCIVIVDSTSSHNH
jgi:hypothetical protein